MNRAGKTALFGYREVTVMKGFIEVTEYDGEMTILIPVGRITGIVRDSKSDVYIEMGTNGDTTSSGVLVQESFEEVKLKIKQSEV